MEVSIKDFKKDSLLILNLMTASVRGAFSLSSMFSLTDAALNILKIEGYYKELMKKEFDKYDERKFDEFIKTSFQKQKEHVRELLEQVEGEFITAVNELKGASQDEIEVKLSEQECEEVIETLEQYLAEHRKQEAVVIPYYDKQALAPLNPELNKLMNRGAKLQAMVAAEDEAALEGVFHSGIVFKSVGKACEYFKANTPKDQYTVENLRVFVKKETKIKNQKTGKWLNESEKSTQVTIWVKRRPY